MVIMSKKKPPAPISDKRGPAISYRPHPELLPLLEQYRCRQRYLPTYSQVFDAALAAFLRSEGVDVPDLLPPEVQ